MKMHSGLWAASFLKVTSCHVLQAKWQQRKYRISIWVKFPFSSPSLQFSSWMPPWHLTRYQTHKFQNTQFLPLFLPNRKLRASLFLGCLVCRVWMMPESSSVRERTCVWCGTLLAAPARGSCPSAPACRSQMPAPSSSPRPQHSQGTRAGARLRERCLPQQPWPCILIGTFNDFLLLSLLSPPELLSGSRRARLPWKLSLQTPWACRTNLWRRFRWWSSKKGMLEGAWGWRSGKRVMLTVVGAGLGCSATAPHKLSVYWA